MNERVMRAKVRVNRVEINDYAEEVTMNPVAKSGPYPDDGGDENNSFARWTPSGEIKLSISNKNLHGKIRPGQEFYVDFLLVGGSSDDTQS